MTKYHGNEIRRFSSQLIVAWLLSCETGFKDYLEVRATHLATLGDCMLVLLVALCAV